MTLPAVNSNQSTLCGVNFSSPYSSKLLNFHRTFTGPLPASCPKAFVNLLFRVSISAMAVFVYLAIGCAVLSGLNQKRVQASRSIKLFADIIEIQKDSKNWQAPSFLALKFGSYKKEQDINSAADFNTFFQQAWKDLANSPIASKRQLSFVIYSKMPAGDFRMNVTTINRYAFCKNSNTFIGNFTSYNEGNKSYLKCLHKVPNGHRMRLEKYISDWDQRINNPTANSSLPKPSSSSAPLIPLLSSSASPLTPSSSSSTPLYVTKAAPKSRIQIASPVSYLPNTVVLANLTNIVNKWKTRTLTEFPTYVMVGFKVDNGSPSDNVCATVNELIETQKQYEEFLEGFIKNYQKDLDGAQGKDWLLEIYLTSRHKITKDIKVEKVQHYPKNPPGVKKVEKAKSPDEWANNIQWDVDKNFACVSTPSGNHRKSIFDKL